jgi:hypothetical protein
MIHQIQLLFGRTLSGHAYFRLVNHTKLFHEKHFGTIKRGFCACSLTSPLARLTFDPDRGPHDLRR